MWSLNVDCASWFAVFVLWLHALNRKNIEQPNVSLDFVLVLSCCLVPEGEGGRGVLAVT